MAEQVVTPPSPESPKMLSSSSGTPEPSTEAPTKKKFGEHTLVEGDYESAPSLMFAALVVLSVTFVGFTFGFDTGTISGITGFPDYIERFGQLNHATGEYYFTTTRKSLIIAFYSVGGGVGGIFLSGFANTIGRKYSLLIFLSIYVVGNIIQITSGHGKWYQMFIGRIITGLSSGALASVAPMFGGELSPAKYRGALVCSFQLFLTLAIFLGYCCDYATKEHNSGAAQWRIVMGLNFLWAFLIFALVWIVVPESPRYLAEIGKGDKAKETIAYINKVPLKSRFVEEEYKAIEEGILTEQAAGTASWKELITGKPKIFPRVVMGFMIMALQQLSGINYFFYYGTTIFAAVGLQDSYQTVIVLGVVNFASTIFSLYFVDKFGRRSTLIGGSIVGAIALYIYTILGVVALYPNGRDEASSKPVGNAMIFLTCLFIAAFAASWGAIGYVILAESFPIRIRAKASSVGILSSFLWNFLISFFTPYITNAIHFSFGFIFAGCLTFAIGYIYFTVYETKGLTLEEVDLMYGDKKCNPWNSANWKNKDKSLDETKVDSTDVSEHETV
ncbi:hexose transporter [Saccharomycopsis crataegensis]|uniref:Hexose transporter n=1 Tax=Saccharomycopsis crataegensis TaxID=43959 RepID=A0AAV5QRE7_9ASCO|nr:hexose transporter [Saccharomycopsis crataegensis]